jgi:hypothetical protein
MRIGKPKRVYRVEPLWNPVPTEPKPAEPPPVEVPKAPSLTPSK